MRLSTAVVVAVALLVACGGNDDGNSSLQADGNLSRPSARELERLATAEHDGYAVVGCDYVLRVNGEVVLNQSEGKGAPFRDIGVTLSTLEQSATIDEELQVLLDEADAAESAPELSAALVDAQDWCTAEGLLPE